MDYFDYGPKHVEADFDIDEFLEQSQERQEERLEKELERINEQLEQRTQIFKENQSDLESKLDWYLQRLERRYKQSGPVTELKQKVEEFYRLLRQERLSHWQDRQQLEKDRRKLLHDLDEIEDNILNEIL